MLANAKELSIVSPELAPAFARMTLEGSGIDEKVTEGLKNNPFVTFSAPASILLLPEVTSREARSTPP